MLFFDTIYSAKSRTYYSVWVNVIDGIIVGWSCECIFASWFRWGSYWRKRGTICKHTKILIRKLKKVGVIK